MYAIGSHRITRDWCVSPPQVPARRSSLIACKVRGSPSTARRHTSSCHCFARESIQTCSLGSCYRRSTTWPPYCFRSDEVRQRCAQQRLADIFVRGTRARSLEYCICERSSRRCIRSTSSTGCARPYGPYIPGNTHPLAVSRRPANFLCGISWATSRYFRLCVRESDSSYLIKLISIVDSRQACRGWESRGAAMRVLVAGKLHARSTLKPREILALLLLVLESSNVVLIQPAEVAKMLLCVFLLEHLRPPFLRIWVRGHSVDQIPDGARPF